MQNVRHVIALESCKGWHCELPWLQDIQAVLSIPTKFPLHDYEGHTIQG